MRIDIDFSIFTPTPSSEGVISGKIEVNELPRVGEIVSFSFAPNESRFPLESGFNPLLKVENVIHNANGQSTAVQLQNLMLPNKKSVIEVTAFLEQGFGLFFSPTSE